MTQFNTTIAFNQVDQYASSRAQSLLLFRTRRFLSLSPWPFATEGWPGWVFLGGWLHKEMVYLSEGCQSPIPLPAYINFVDREQCVITTPTTIAMIY